VREDGAQLDRRHVLDGLEGVDEIEVVVLKARYSSSTGQSYDVCIFFTGISDTIPCRFLLQAGSNTTTITRHHCHRFPTVSLEHLSLSLKSTYPSPLLAYFILDPKCLG
jgi:hypothetical protein